MMKEDQMTLAPTEIYGRSDEEQSGLRIWRRKTEEPPAGVCLVYSLSAIVIGFAVFLILLMFLRGSEPATEIVSISIRDLLFNSSSSNPYLNATLVSEISIRNSNSGYFEFKNSTFSVIYDSKVVGETMIGGSRVDARETVIITGIVVEISSLRLSNASGLGSDLRLGVLDLRTAADIEGWVKVMGKKRGKISKLESNMRLNLKFVM